MSATTQHLLGQLADGRFPLRKLLGVSPNSAVFLTYNRPEHPGDPAPDAAIKLIPEEPSTSAAQLEHWRSAAALAHPGLLRIFHFGRCVIDGAPCLYIVTELANEDLGQLLAHRALSPDEARGVLASILPALDFLHENGFVHAGLKPSNIHAIGDNIKLSVDRILPAGESTSTWPLAAPFAPPESVLFPASDIWSLGTSLCETLTKVLPASDTSRRFTLPELPVPFSEIVRSALVEDPTLRISLDQVRSLLDPSFVAKPKPAPVAKPVSAAASRSANAAATSAPSSVQMIPPESPESPESLVAVVEPASATAASAHSAQATSQVTQRAPLPQIDPLSVPLSPVSPKAAPIARAPIPVKSLPQVNATIGSTRRVISPNPAPRSNKLFLAGAAAAVVLALLAVPRYLSRSGNSTTPSSPNSASRAPSSPANNAPSSSRPIVASSAPSTIDAPPAKSGNANSAPAAKSNSAANSPATSAAPPAKISSAPISKPAATPSPTASAPNSASAGVSAKPVAPTVIRKILPEVSEKARNTIRGSVRINVRVQLNPDGTVSSAELANPAASQFFADLALKAARQWQFGPPASADSASSSEPPTSATIRFDFTQISTAATALP
ncbi:MAG TPA: TonB family protein [Candidatus Acidoferrum sp.]